LTEKRGKSSRKGATVVTQNWASVWVAFWVRPKDSRPSPNIRQKRKESKVQKPRKPAIERSGRLKPGGQENSRGDEKKRYFGAPEKTNGREVIAFIGAALKSKGG